MIECRKYRNGLIWLICCIAAICVGGSGNAPVGDERSVEQDRRQHRNNDVDRGSHIWRAELGRNAVSLESLIDGDFDGLGILQNSIGKRRLVQLGESSHGVAEFNRVKVKLIKYLHQVMGFSVVAFESGLAECFFADRNMSGEGALGAMESIFWVWRTEEVLELFDYIAESKRGNHPLTLAGFDFQVSGDWSIRRRTLYDMIAPFDSGFAREFVVADSLFVARKDAGELAAMRDYVREKEMELRGVYSRLEELISVNAEELIDQYEAVPVMPLVARQIALSMLAYIDFWLDEENEMEIRDRAMAANVEFLANTAYPDSKIIVWAHNYHIQKNSHLVDWEDSEPTVGMGTILNRKGKEQMYTVGLYMYQGQAAFMDRQIYEIENHDENSLESILRRSGEDYLFVDMMYTPRSPESGWMDEKIPAKSWGRYDIRLVPNEQYDALVFVNIVTPPDYIE